MISKDFSLNAIDHKLLKLALEEDLGTPYHDVTTAYLFSNLASQATAYIVNKHLTPIVIAGLSIIPALFELLTSHYDYQSCYQDGAKIGPGATIAMISGEAGTILKLERTFLNFLRHLSGIATLTAQFVEKVAGTSTKILDTRKTTPGLRHLEKYAVVCGGGINHRFGLYDAIMVKDTHIDQLGGILPALECLKAKPPSCPVIVEVRNQMELDTVIKLGQGLVNQVLLDNMSIEELNLSVKRAQPYFKTEASGNITLDTITDIADTKVDYASVGQITHSAPQVDLSLRIEIC